MASSKICYSDLNYFLKQTGMMKTKHHKENKQTENWVTLVSGVIAASNNLVFEQSTKEIFNPNSVATCLKYLFVPEAEENQIKWKENCIRKY